MYSSFLRIQETLPLSASRTTKSDFSCKKCLVSKNCLRVVSFDLFNCLFDLKLLTTLTRLLRIIFLSTESSILSIPPSISPIIVLTSSSLLLGSIENFVRAPYHSNLAPKLNNIFKNTNIKLAYYNKKTSKQFFGKVKDKTDPLEKTKVVYKLNCNCGKKYVGQTKQYLKTRLRQHRSDVDKRLTKTGLCNHITNNPGHTIDWDNVKILDEISNDKTRQFYEMCHIITTDDTVNIQTDFNSFNNVYTGLIKKFN